MPSFKLFKQRPSIRILGTKYQELTAIPQEELNEIFVCAVLTSIFVFIICNFLLLDRSTLILSSKVELVCLGCFAILYGLSERLKSISWGYVLLYGLISLPIISSQHWLIIIWYFALLFSLLKLILRLRTTFERLFRSVIPALISAIVISFATTQYTSFDLLSRLNIGLVHQDTLFHASISAMLKNYGIASTGLHGLVETPYHIFSHILFAGISLISGVGVFEVYGIANYVLFSVLLIFGLVAHISLLTPADSKRKNIPLYWTSCALLITLTIYYTYGHPFVSESHLVSLGLLSATIPLLHKDRLLWSDYLLGFLSGFFITLSKGSVGVIYGCVVLGRFLFKKHRKVILDLVFVCLVFVGIYLASKNSVSANQVHFNQIRFLHYVRNYWIFGDWINLFILHTRQELYFLPISLLRAWFSFVLFIAHEFWLPILVIFLVRMKTGNWKSVLDCPSSLFSIASFLPGFLAVMFLAIPGGSAGYFSYVSPFVAIPQVAYLFSQNFNCFTSEAKQWMRKGLIIFLLIITLVCIRNGSVLTRLRLGVVDSRNEFVSMLINLRSEPRNTVFETTLSIKKLNPIERCTAQPFIYPALSEHPWLNIIVEDTSCFYQYYGYHNYGITDDSQKVTVSPRLLPNMKVVKITGINNS